MSSSGRAPRITPMQMALAIDHTLLRAEATHHALDRLCREATGFGFKAVCVNSCHAAYAAARLQGSSVRVCTVVGFPLGAMHRRAKAFEAEQAVADGALELDMVMNIGALKSGDAKAVEQDILAVRRAAPRPTVLKVIIETFLLTEAEKTTACRLCMNAGANFVKTSTGFAGGSATEADVALMRRTVGSTLGVKASGGIKDWDTAAAMIAAGANRIGTSAGPAIMQGARG